MIDLQAVRDAYTSHEISNVGFLRAPNNPADGMTKIGPCAALDHLLRTGKTDFLVEQWVLRHKIQQLITSSVLSSKLHLESRHNASRETKTSLEHWNTQKLAHKI